MEHILCYKNKTEYQFIFIIWNLDNRKRMKVLETHLAAIFDLGLADVVNISMLSLKTKVINKYKVKGDSET